MPAILDQFGSPIRPPASAARRRAVRAIYDAAQTTGQNENHWANADALSAAAAGSPETRRTLRQRARYEAANNCYAGGLCQDLANSLIGTGPRPQIRTESTRLNRWLDREFSAWLESVQLAETLRTAKIAKVTDGEVFLELTTDPGLPGPVKLLPRAIEADRITTPDLNPLESDAIDGIRFNAAGRPVAYHRLRHHPGDLIGDLSYETIPAERMLHLFRRDRPGQVRGISELTPALPLFAQLRRYVLATIASAETAADYAAVMYTDSPALDPEDIPNLSPDDGLPIQDRTYQVLPNGWKISQLKAEQPTTQFAEFRAAIVTEIARAVLAPRNVATGDSSQYNYASGRLDKQAWLKNRDIERDYFRTTALDPLFEAWLREASLVEGYLPDEFFLVEMLPLNWHWDGDPHVDPTKEAAAAKVRLTNGTTTRRREYARDGRDLDAEDEAAAESYGVTVEEYRRALFAQHFPRAQATGQSAQSQGGTDANAPSQSAAT